MRICKIINNNIVSSIDERNKEVIVMGKGIGFGKRLGSEIDEGAIEKIFSLPKESTSRFEKLVGKIPYEHIQLAEKIIQYAGKNLGLKLNKNIYITLTDHLSYAIERSQKGIRVQNAFLWEIQKFYQKEYQIGIAALDMIQKKTGAKLPEDEAGFIAVHLINAEMNTNMKQSAVMPVLIKDVTNIVKYTMGIEFDEGSLSYERLVTHLKFFLQRMIRQEDYREQDDAMQKAIREHYADEYNCALKIRGYVNAKLGYEVSEEELMYLTIHINRVVKTEKGSKE